jgi:hypothetical protein
VGLRPSPRVAAALAVAVTLVVSALWFRRARTPVVESALEGTVSIRVVRHDAYGAPGKPTLIRDRGHVRAVVEALGVDDHAPAPCPPDYATAELGLVLSGRDVYTKRNVYVWSSSASPRVVVVTTSGCTAGPPRDRARLAIELDDAGVRD